MKKKSKYPTASTTYNKPFLVYLTPPQYDALHTLSKQSRIPRAALMREACDDLLKKHRGQK